MREREAYEIVDALVDLVVSTAGSPREDLHLDEAHEAARKRLVDLLQDIPDNAALNSRSFR